MEVKLKGGPRDGEKRWTSSISDNLFTILPDGRVAEYRGRAGSGVLNFVKICRGRVVK